MLHAESKTVREHLEEGNFGLEKESLRVTADGRFSHSPHPFPGDPHIVKDFCENQTEINTGVHQSIRGAVDELSRHNGRIYRKLSSLPEPEYLWPFSNPPHITDESDVPVALFGEPESWKHRYRQYLSDKYGRYKMSFCGIHVNFSFSDKLLHADYAAFGEGRSFREYRDRLYLDLAAMLAAYGWILVAVTAASPVLDGSYLLKNAEKQDVFSGMGSVRCSELGYWNEFTPVFDYSDTDAYADSIRIYVEKGYLQAPSELYYPVRLKPRGRNNLAALRENGIDHIELRMFDLNPYAESCVEEKDVRFAHLLILWLACREKQPFGEADQIAAAQNYKNAARFDLKTVKILTPAGEQFTVAEAALRVIGMLSEFCRKTGIGAEEVLSFEREKFVHGENRYAWRVRAEFGEDFAGKALRLAKERQERYV